MQSTTLAPSRESDPHRANSSGDSDELLLHRLASGDCEALSFLFRRYAKVAYGIARRILGDPSEAEDCVQEVFIYFHRKAGVFNSEKGGASSWIVQTIYHQALRHRMRLAERSSRSGILIEHKSGHAPTSATAAEYERSLEWAVGTDKLREVMKSLTKDQRDTLRLHFFDGYTLSEIARKRGQSLGNVRHHFYRGLEKLRSSVFRVELKGRISSSK